MKIKLISLYSIFLGFAITGLWIVILKSDEIAEGKLEMTFHLFSEFLMAVLCILSGFKLLFKHRNAIAVNILAHGMIIYSVLNAAGYYGQRKEFHFMGLFLFLLIISFLIILSHLLNSVSDNY